MPVCREDAVISIAKITDKGALAADERFWSIIEAIPEQEREPRATILHCFDQDGVHFVRAQIAGETVGLATYQTLKSEPALFLGYLAVDESCRGRSLGRLLLDWCWHDGSSRLHQAGHRSVGMIAEVDFPTAGSTPDDRLVSRKRFGFYERAGFHPLPASYYLPPMEGVTPWSMHLLHRPPQGAAPGDRRLQRRLTRALYRDKYGAHNGIAKPYLDELMQRSLWV